MKNPSKNIVLAVSVFWTLMSCSADQSNQQQSTQKAKVSGSFAVFVDGELSFNQDTPRASAHLADNNLVAFKAKDHYFRIMALRMPEQGEARTDELNFNNTQFSTVVEINGKPQQIGCKPKQEPVGFFHRTQIDDETISGEFSVQFETCSDYITTNPVAYPANPITVTGSFSKIKLK